MGAKEIEPLFWMFDVERAIRFYTEALGFELKQRYPDEGPPTWCSLRRDGLGIMLSARPTTADTGFRKQVEARLGRPGACTIYVPVDDPDAHHARAVAAGARVVDPLQDTYYGLREYTVADPEGHWLTFYRELKK